MVSQNILTIDISNIDFNSSKFKMVDTLTLDKVKIKYNWIFNAQIKDAIIGEDANGLVWYSGTWVNGTWENGTWYSGTFLNGRWKDGNVYSYDIDLKQLFNGNFYIIRTDISKTHFVNCSFEGGKFNYGIFGTVKQKTDIETPYVLDKDFVIDNIDDYIIDNGFNSGCNIGFYLQTTDENNLYTIKTLEYDSDNRILVGGRFSKYNEIKASGILRLNYDGTLNNTFNGGISENGIVNKIYIDSNNRILIGGDFSKYNDTVCNGIIRIFEDGTIDEEFTSILESGNIVNDIYVDEKGSIYLGGSFEFNTSTYKYVNLIKLNEDGTIDTTFGITFNSKQNIIFDDVVNVIKPIVLDSYTKILIGGKFTMLYNSTTGYSYDKIIRLNLDGTKDNSYLTYYSFDEDLGVNVLYDCDNTISGTTVNTIEIDSNNNIYIGGDFKKYTYIEKISDTDVISNAVCKGIVKLQYDGRIDYDNIFVTNAGFSYDGDGNMEVKSIKIDSKNRIVIGGLFNYYNTNGEYNNIIRINTEGDYDDTFILGSGTYNNNESYYNGEVETLLIDSNDKIYLGGMLNIYNTVSKNLLIRINVGGDMNSELNKIFLDTTLNTSVFKGGDFIDGLFNSSIFEDGNFYGGILNNSLFLDGTWYGGLFLEGDWYNGLFLGGEFSNGNWYNGELTNITNGINTVFGINYKNYVESSANWYDGKFTNGKFYSLYHKDLDETEKLIYGVDVLDENHNNLVNWYSGTFDNGAFYGGTIHSVTWNNGIIYDSVILDIVFNKGHIVDTICYNGTFNGGSISGGFYDNVVFDDINIGYEIN